MINVLNTFNTRVFMSMRLNHSLTMFCLLLNIFYSSVLSFSSLPLYLGPFCLQCADINTLFLTYLTLRYWWDESSPPFPHRNWIQLWFNDPVFQHAGYSHSEEMENGTSVTAQCFFEQLCNSPINHQPATYLQFFSQC